MNHNIFANTLFCITVENLAHASMTEYTQRMYLAGQDLFQKSSHNTTIQFISIYRSVQG